MGDAREEELSAAHIGLKMVVNSSNSVSALYATLISGTFVRVMSFPAIPSFMKLGPSQCFLTYKINTNVVLMFFIYRGCLHIF